MADVAASAGVSTALVSIVMRDAPGASAPTRERVRAAAAELGYRPDARARSLRRSRSHLLGVVFGLHHPFHADLVEGVYAAAEPAGYGVVLSAVAPSRDERRAVESLLDDRCEALLLLGPESPTARLAELGARLPVVAVARSVATESVEVVRSGDADGAAQAVDHLVGLGHRHIAHVDGGRAPGAAERRRGYRAAMRRHGLADREQLVPGGMSAADGAGAVPGLLAGAQAPTAVLAFNDECATGVLDALLRAGVPVPTGVSVVGFDDSHLARLPHVDLTTVAQDARDMARLAVGKAVARLEGTEAGGREAVVPPRLVVRGTTAGPRKRLLL
jgi:DNA-binding LacI/PurR family transcriptional regulator